MRPFVLKRGKIRIERHRIKRPLHIDEHSLFQIRRVGADLLHGHVQIHAETVEELRHARGRLHIALRTVVVVPLHTAEECDREKQNDDEIAVARREAVAQIFDADKQQRRKREKREHIPDIIAELAVRRDVVVGVKVQVIPSFSACRLLRVVRRVKCFTVQKCIQYAILFSPYLLL